MNHASDERPGDIHEALSAGQSSVIDAGSTDATAPRGIFRSSRVGQAVGLYLPATVAFRLINFLRIIILSWFMVRQQFGLLNMILIVVNVLTPLCSFGVNDAVIRYAPQHEARGTLAAFLRRSGALLLAFIGGTALVMLAFAPWLGAFFFANVVTEPYARRDLSAQGALAIVSAVSVALMVVYFYQLSVFKGLRMFTALSLMEMLHGGLFLALALAAVAVGQRSALAITVTYAISLLAPIVAFGVGFSESLRRWDSQQGPVGAERVTIALLRFGLWSMLAGVLWQVLTYYPAWYLNKIHGNEAVAVFSAVRQIGQFVLVAAVAVVAIVFSSVARTWETLGPDAANRQWSLAFRASGFGLFVGCALVALAKDLVIRLLRPDYAAGAAILPLQLLFFLLAAYLSLLAIHFQLIEKTRYLLWPWLAGILTNIGVAALLAGPAVAAIRDTAWWKGMGRASSWVFSAGFSDASGLGAASWCGVIAIAVSLGLCLALLRAEGRTLDRSTYCVIFLAMLLGMQTWMLAVGLVASIVLALTTDLCFTKPERRRIFALVVDAIRHVPLFARRNIE